MRVLLSCRSYTGHLLPMLPLARALLEAGHQVACASGPTAGAQAQRLGLEVFPAGPDQMTPAERDALFPQVRSLSPAEVRPFFFGRVFTGHELPLRAQDLGAAIADWKPDLLVHEIAEFAGPMVATMHGLPYATHSFGVIPADEVIAAAAEGAAPYWRAAGLVPHPRAGLWEHAYLDICPASLQRGTPAGAPLVQPIRPAERTAPNRRPGRPLVYVTLGTVYNNDTASFRAILDGLADLGVDVLVTVGQHGDPAAFGPQPDHVRIERFIPQADILSTCTVVITHGGAGSTLGALTFGCPIVFVPQGADQFINAERVTAAGAGLTIPPSRLTADEVRDAVEQILANPSYTESAQQLSDEIHAMPPPGTAITTLEYLATRRSAPQHTDSHDGRAVAP